MREKSKTRSYSLRRATLPHAPFPSRAKETAPEIAPEIALEITVTHSQSTMIPSNLLIPSWLEAAFALPPLDRPIVHLPLLVATAAAIAGAWALFGAVRLVATYRTLSIWPSPPTSSWFFGHGAALATPAHHLVLARWAATWGSVYTLRVAWKRAVVVTHPALATAILDARPARTGLDKGGLYSRFNALNPDPARGTIFTSPSDAHWGAVRAAVAPCFTPKAVRARYEALAGPPAAAAAWLAERASGACGKQAGVTAATPPSAPSLFDADDLMMRAALDAVASACFGLTCGAVPEPGCSPAPAIFETMRICQDWLNTTAMAPWAGLVGALSAPARAGRAAMKNKKAYALGLAHTLRARGSGDGDPASAASALLSVVDPETGGPLSPARLAGEAVTLLEAGFETTGHTAAYALALLARNPTKQVAAVAELGAAGLVWAPGGGAGRPLAPADLGALPYLSACVKEAMRLFPVVADGPVRTAGRTVTLGAGSPSSPLLTIPAGTLVLVPFFAAGRDAGAWGEDVSAFRPERWLLEGGVDDAHPPRRLYTPFSRGSRNCVGAALGQAMALTLVASVLARVEVGWPGGGVDGGGGGGSLPPLADGLEIRLTLQPKDKLMLVVREREDGWAGGEGGIKAGR